MDVDASNMVVGDAQNPMVNWANIMLQQQMLMMQAQSIVTQKKKKKVKRKKITIAPYLTGIRVESPESGAKKATKTKTKKKRVTKKSQTGTSLQVWQGSKIYMASGLTRKDLMLSKTGKVVSIRRSQMGRKHNSIKQWCSAVKEARKALNLTGFTKVKRGSPFYKKIREIYAANKKKNI